MTLYYKCTGRKRKLNDCKKHTVRQDYLEDLEIKLATLKNANNSPIDVGKCYHFLYSLLKLDLNLIANRKKLINTFVRKVMLSDEVIKFYFIH